ncbi:uncharacterized protein LOC109846370 [Asparagus officinalis]|uniref:uncharacterized protein LOC109846370 n=1 Tax=Asparagus officinalis TaxID=4686 RepID=UPI00098E4FC4|nr:uncharacterized protein LOC109846370 [Asparagus officinalis]
MNEVLYKGPWFFGSRPMLLKPWTIDMETNKSDECLYPLWIQLPALRLNLWNSKSISKIASIIGKPITTDMLTANKQRLTYARVLVEVKVSSPLPDHITIQWPNGKTYNQKVLYEFKPRWCGICKFVGHDTNFYKKKRNIQKWISKVKQVIGDNSQVAPISEMHNLKVANQDVIEGNNKGKCVAQEFMQASKNHQSHVHVVHVLGDYSNNETRSAHSERSRLYMNNGKSPYKFSDYGMHFQGNSSNNETHYADNSRLIMNSEPAHLVQILGEATEARSMHVVHSQFPESGSSHEYNTWIPIQVYGYNNMQARKDLWTKLSLIHKSIGNIPWLICGDFNTMLCSEEKLGGSVLTDADTNDFSSFIEDCQLSHLKTIGCFFTWNNKQDQDTRVWSRLDRALVNDDWIHQLNSGYKSLESSGQSSSK